MKPGDWIKLSQIRKTRAEKALRAMLSRRADLQRAEQKVSEIQQAADEIETRASTFEKNRLSQMMGHSFSSGEFMTMQSALNAFDDNLDRLVEEIEEADRELTDKQNALTSARHVYRNLQNKVEKLDQIVAERGRNDLKRRDFLYEVADEDAAAQSASTPQQDVSGEGSGNA